MNQLNSALAVIVVQVLFIPNNICNHNSYEAFSRFICCKLRSILNSWQCIYVYIYLLCRLGVDYQMDSKMHCFVHEKLHKKTANNSINHFVAIQLHSYVVVHVCNFIYYHHISNRVILRKLIFDYVWDFNHINNRFLDTV